MTNRTTYKPSRPASTQSDSPPPPTAGRRFNLIPFLTNGYTIAILGPLFALTLWWFTRPVSGDVFPPMFFNIAVVLAAWRGGFRPGLIAVVLSVALAAYFIYPPTGSFTIANSGQAIRLGLAAIVGVFVAWIGDIALRATKRSEDRADALRESEARYRALFENQPIGLGICDPAGRIVSLNTAALETHGFASASDMPSAPDRYGRIFELQYLDGRPMPLDEWPVSRAMRGEYVIDYVVRLINLVTNQERIVSYTVNPLLENGRPARFLFVMQDLTERRRTDQALRRSEEKYHTILNSIDEGFCICEMLVDDDGTPYDYRWLEINHTFERHTGLENPIGRTALDLVPNLEPHWIEIYGRVALTGEPVRFEQRSEVMGRWFDVFAFRIGDPSLLRFGILFTDITERKRAEIEVRANEERLRLALRAANMDAFVFDPRSDRVRRSGSLWPLLGLEEEGTGTEYFEHIHPDDRMAFLSTVRGLTSADPTYTIEYRFRIPDGTWRWLADRAEMHFDPDGTPSYLNGVCTDITDRKESERALRESQERHDLVSRATNDIMWDWDLITNRLEWNQAIESVTGRSLADMPPTIQSWYDHIHPEDYDRVTRGIHDAIDSGADSWTGEYRFGPFGGPWRTFLDRGLIARDASGKAHRMVGSMLDTTDRNRAELALRESERRFRATFENAAVGIAHVALDGRWLRINDRYCAITGYTREELLAKSFVEITHPDDLQGDLDQIRRLLDGAIDGYSLEKRYMRPEGSPVWVNLTRSLVRTPEGRPEYYISVIQDITARKSYQSELEFQKFALDQASIVAITDAAGTITYVNDKFIQISGYSRDELVGQNHRIINSGYHSREFFRDLYATIRKGQVWRGEIRNRRKNGTYYWVDTTIVPAIGPNGRPERYVAIRTDITERKRYEEALRRNEATLAQAGRMARLGAWEIEVTDRENLNNNPLSWSDETFRILGYEPGAVSITNDLFFQHVHPDDRQAIVDAISSAIATREPYSLEHRMTRADGSEIYVSEYAELSFDLNGNLTRIIGTVQDITERKHAEQERERLLEQLKIRTAEAEEGQQILQAIMENTPIGITIADANGRIRMISSAGERMTGRTSEELRRQPIGRHVETWGIFLPDGVTPAPRSDVPLFRAIQHGETTLNQELTLRRPDGTLIPIIATAAPIKDSAGRIAGGVNAWVDITDRKRIEDALRESEMRFSTAFRAAPDAQVISRLDDGVITEANDAFLSFFGFTREEILGQTSRSLHMWTDPEQRDEAILLMSESGRLRDFEVCVRLRSGEERDVSLTAEQIVIGGEDFILVILHDITERKRFENTLRQSEARFRQLADSMPQLVWTANPDGVVDYYNQRHLEYAGIEQQPEGAFHWAPVLHPDDVPRTVEAWERAVRTGQTYQIEHRVRTLDGRYRWLLSRAVPARDEQGDIVKWYGTATDIDNVKLAEEALRESEERFRTLADNMSQFAWMTDRNGSVLWYNRRWYEYTGTTFDEMQGWGWQKIHHPDHLDRVVDYFRKSIAAGEPWEDTFPLRSKDGEYRWFLSRALPIHDRFGNIVRWFGTNTDITEQLRFQQELEQRTDDLALVNEELSRLHRETRRILESIAEMYLLIDREGTILDMNHMAEQYSFKAPRKEVEGKRLWDVMADDQGLATFRQYHEQALTEHKPVHFEAFSSILDKWLEIHAYPSSDRSLIAIYYHDITARKRALLDLEERTRELEAANEDLRRLGGFLAHDLRAPLRTVRGFAEALQEDLNDTLDDEHRDYLNRVVSGSMDMDNLIQDLLRLTRLDTSNLDIQDVDLGDIARGIIDDLCAKFSDRVCRHHIHANLRARADHRLITIALTNLIGNAMKFSAHREQTEIEVGSEVRNLTASENPGGKTVYFVRDNGIGFDPARADKLFQPFQRLHADKGFAGTGLGLTIVQRVIARHHGRIWAESTPDSGTTFFFTLEP